MWLEQSDTISFVLARPSTEIDRFGRRDKRVKENKIVWMRGDGMEGNHGKRRQMDAAEENRNPDRSSQSKTKLQYLHQTWDAIHIFRRL